MPHSTPLTDTLKLLAALQKERGIAILSETQQEMTHAASFDKQATNTYKTLTTAQKENPDFWILLPERFFDAFAVRNNEAFRKGHKIENLIEWYLFNLEQPIYQMVISSITNSPHFSPAQTSALIHFAASLGYLCQLRDIGISIYAKAEMSISDTRRLKNAATSYLARERLFLGLAEENLKKKMDEAKGSPIAAISKLDEILRRIKEGFAKSVMADIAFPNWFHTLNNELENLHIALHKTIKSLTQDSTDLAAQNTYSQALDHDIESQLHSIGTLPLFRGLPETTLRMILKGARLMELNKNKVFLRQGETLSRHYIMIDGWAKTYKTNTEGQESIIQILSKKESILDIGLSGSTMTGLSAKTISNAYILSIPLSTLRDHASRNRELTQNLLAATQKRLGRLVGQYEQITLHTAMERVGWFFVNLHLETGLEGKPLQLPFDKSLIAAYLNIKPETFSRTLKSFRKLGFVINKNEVELPHPHALCDYCDPEMALRCCRAEASNCAPIQAARKLSETNM